MKIIDITRELFDVPPYPGDPAPQITKVLSFEKENPDVCQSTELKMGVHNGTHLDAPRHFMPGGKTCERLALERVLGPCKVVESAGSLNSSMIKEWLSDGTKRLLIKGDIEVTPEASREMAAEGLMTLGIEYMTVGTQDTMVLNHQILLGAEIVIIENLDLAGAETGEYMLSALPLKIREIEGSPVRAVLFEM